MKKALAALLALFVLIAMTACTGSADEYAKREHMFFGTFDTIIQIIGYSKDAETFNRVAKQAQALFERYHQVYDAYNAYDGVKNVYYINEEAAKGPVAVEKELMELLLYARENQAKTLGTMNITLGTVLKIWHDAREVAENTPQSAYVPSMEELLKAAEHVNIDDLMIDEQAGTVFFKDPALRLDVGAVAKGYATEQVAQFMLSSEVPSFIISAGGNVRAGEAPLDGRENWLVSVQDPEKFAMISNTENMLDKLYVKNKSVVTSGDYERYYVVDGEKYHHIISPETLMPARDFCSVTVVCEDSGLADILSTTFFILSLEEGRALAAALGDVDVMWVDHDMHIEMTEGMEEISYNTIRK